MSPSCRSFPPWDAYEAQPALRGDSGSELTLPPPLDQANAIGRSSKTVREFLEKNWKADMIRDEVIQLAVKSLLEVVQTGAKNIDLAVMDGFGKVRVSRLISLAQGATRPQALSTATDSSTRRPPPQNLTHDELTSVVSDIEREKEAEAERKRSRLAQSAASRDAMLTGTNLGDGLGAGATAEEDAGAGEA